MEGKSGSAQFDGSGVYDGLLPPETERFIAVAVVCPKCEERFPLAEVNNAGSYDVQAYEQHLFLKHGIRTRK